ncbi:hypothetical protein [Desulfovibrio sp. TomC]|uniref:hypothetical protein n=1 Tax=Desulfovibrio sp. TomC TaxID=1562888 RepID=UPI0005743A7D|nr:hypothetical protein [Desulfovibrio sp. TomC]KHK02508.1 hypothetical protein NY78_2266 [Desulfovibrio sp. TomC]
MGRLTVLVAAMVLAVSGCLAPGPEAVVRNWRPDGAGGRTLGQLVAVSPGLAGATWEAYDGPSGEPMVRLAAEYAPAKAAGGCPVPAAGSRLGARVFLILSLTVGRNGTVDFASAEGQAYTAGGAFASYPLDIGVIAALVARACPLPCPALAVPDYL